MTTSGEKLDAGSLIGFLCFQSHGALFSHVKQKGSHEVIVQLMVTTTNSPHNFT